MRHTCAFPGYGAAAFSPWHYALVPRADWTVLAYHYASATPAGPVNLLHSTIHGVFGVGSSVAGEGPGYLPAGNMILPLPPQDNNADVPPHLHTTVGGLNGPDGSSRYYHCYYDDGNLVSSCTHTPRTTPLLRAFLPRNCAHLTWLPLLPAAHALRVGSDNPRKPHAAFVAVMRAKRTPHAHRIYYHCVRRAARARCVAITVVSTE